MTSGGNRLGAVEGTGGVAVICTALREEYTAVHEHLTDPVVLREVNGTLFESRTFHGQGGAWKVVQAHTGAGNTAAGVVVERAISEFSPQVVLFVGIAGGLKDLELGDVVAADAIYDYESGKDLRADYRSRSKPHRASYRMVQYAEAVARAAKWQQRIKPGCPNPPPDAVVKPLAAGAKVVAHRRSRTAQHLDRYCEEAVAVEMEGHGFLHGAYVNAGVDALVIRGISDLLTGKNPRADRHWQPRAAAHAAAFAFELLNRNSPYPEVPRAVAKDLLFGNIDQRMEAVRKLGSSRYANAVPLLVEGFDKADDPDVSCRIISALHKLGPVAAKDALQALNPRYDIEKLIIRDALEAWREQPHRQGDELP